MQLSFTPLLLVGLVVGLLVGVALGAGVTYLTRAPCPDCDLECMPTICPDCHCPDCVCPEPAGEDAEESYYRGIWDTWVWVSNTTGQQVNVASVVNKCVANDWFGQPSTGWRWPLVSPTPTPGNDG